MQIIGVVCGEYEGNKWAKIITTEPVPDRPGCVGLNAVISKANYTFVHEELFPNYALYVGQEVALYYDRFGKVQSVKII